MVSDRGDTGGRGAGRGAVLGGADSGIAEEACLVPNV